VSIAASFVVPGVPIAKHRPRTVMVKGRVRTYTPKLTKDYEKEVAWEAKRARVRRHDGIVAVTLRFFGARGDLDNIIKSALDGMIGICFNDDRQVEELHAYVDRKGKPARTEVEIRTKDEFA
jgi:Holliday junction resolvase RusA-like endonuclease